MGVLDGGADPAEEIEPPVDRELMGVAVLVDGHSLDELHDQIGAAVLRAAAVVEAGDIGVLEAGQDLPFGKEAMERLGALQP